MHCLMIVRYTSVKHTHEKLVKNLGDDYRIVIEQLHMNIQRQWSSRALLCFENHTGRLKTATLANLIN